MRRHHCTPVRINLSPLALSIYLIWRLRNRVKVNILMTGMFLQKSCSMVKVRSANPDIAGNSTSVNMRSRSGAFLFNVSHAFNPSWTAVTARKKLPLEVQKHHIILKKGKCTSFAYMLEGRNFQKAIQFPSISHENDYVRLKLDQKSIIFQPRVCIPKIKACLFKLK